MSEINSLLLLSQTLGDEELANEIKKSRILLVGAGGIGSEVIKNMLLMGFESIEMIDLDTIDVSNLNRQFLFNRQHVGKSKAETAAKVAVENFGHNSSVSVKAIHNSIQSNDFDIDYYKSFTLVINALDNKAARSHVNRMCLAADVPLIESGSEGYLGQVFLIKKPLTQCYECGGPKQDNRSYASCTIRNTPSLPIHCIVWAKHLFAQLFGEEDADNDVSPDMSDPELNNNETNASNANDANDENKTTVNGTARTNSTRDWAQKCDYNTKQLFNKLFETDIEYLLRMDKLWENRQKPFSINYEKVVNNEIEFSSVEGSSHEVNGSADKTNDLKAQRLWSINECLTVFDESIKQLKDRLNSEKFLVWDKDDESALNFVTAVSNLRSFCFHIERKSKFDVKSMAGNIIPAISSTNSIVGGIIALQCLNVLRNSIESKTKTKEESDKSLYNSCRHVVLRGIGPSTKSLISAYELEKPNPDCLVCSSTVPEIEISLNISETQLISEFVDQIIFGKLHFVCPDIKIDGTSTVIWSKDDYDESTDAEKERTNQKKLSFNDIIKDKTRLCVDDLLSNLKIIITLRDEKIDKNENEGLFYKMTITREGDNPINQNNGDTTGTVETATVEVNDSNDNQMESFESEENSNQITTIDDDEPEAEPQIVGVEPNEPMARIPSQSNDVEEVTISDSDSDSDMPVIIDDDSVHIIEISEKRKLDPESDDNSVIKRHKSSDN